MFREKQYMQSYKLTKKFGTSYFYSALLLSKSERKHIYALYSLCRYADDLVDVVDGTPGTDKNAKRNLSKFRKDVMDSIVEHYEGDDLLGAISKTWNDLQLPIEFLERFFNSMEMDLKIAQYDSFEDLLIYMDGSAAVIGEMVLPVIEPDITNHDAVRDCARALGNAFQLTNFLRDVGEDQLRGRIYIPQKDLAEFGVDAERFELNDSFIDLMKFEISRNRKLYEQAYEGVVSLRGRRGACVRAAFRLYGGILKEIELNGYDVFSKRARMSTTRKIFITVRELFRLSPQSFKI